MNPFILPMELPLLRSNHATYHWCSFLKQFHNAQANNNGITTICSFEIWWNRLNKNKKWTFTHIFVGIKYLCNNTHSSKITINCKIWIEIIPKTCVLILSDLTDLPIMENWIADKYYVFLHIYCNYWLQNRTIFCYQ